jgi:hypothetical protein
MFNFSMLSEQNFTSNAGAYLRPYDIYTVNLTKIEKTVLKGSKDPNAEYPVVALEFTGTGDNKGTFSANLFIPTTDEDMKRPVYKNNEGHEYERPSRFENFQFTLMQIVSVLNPDGAKKIQENGKKLQAALDKDLNTGINLFIDLIIKALAGKDKIETNLKLVGRNNNGTIYAALPNACGLNKDGECFAVNFIGDNLFFTNYELTQQKNYQNAKPTKMADNPDIPDTSGDIDVDDIEL